MLHKLFLALFLSTACALSGEIYQVTLDIESVDCDFCVREIKENFKKIPQIQEVIVFPHADIVYMDWEKDSPFHVSYLFPPFHKSKLKIYQVEIDFQGTFYRGRNLDSIKTKNGSVFYIDQASPCNTRKFTEGGDIRVKGTVTNHFGNNMVFIREVVWINPLTPKTLTQLPHTVEISS